MSMNENIVRWLGVSRWPVLMRHPVIKLLLKRKRLQSFPYRVRLGALTYDGDAANLIDYHVLTRGGFEPGLDQLLVDWSLHSGGKHKVFLDVGANSGLHAIQLSGYFREVHAFEPYPPMYERLCHSIRINELSNVFAHQVALSDEAGEAAFRPPALGNTGTGSLVADSEDCVDDGLIRVCAATGDAYLEHTAGVIGAIKIDVEGAERRVLDGLRERINHDRPLLVFEVLRGGDEVRSSFAARLPPDYAMFLLKNIKRPRYVVESWRGQVGDVIALPADQARAFLRL